MRTPRPLLALLLASGAASTQETALPDYLPMAVGHRWTYRTDYDEETEFTHEVVSKQKVGDVECFVVEHRSMNPAFDRPRVLRKEWLAVSAEGLKVHQLQRGRGILGVETPFFKLKRRLLKNDEWEGAAKAESNAPRYRVWVEDEEEVEVPAGRYQARRLRLRVESGDHFVMEGLEWYAPEVGLVKADTRLTSSAETFRFATELKAFAPAR
jgi:hypothetical protein